MGVWQTIWLSLLMKSWFARTSGDASTALIKKFSFDLKSLIALSGGLRFALTEEMQLPASKA